MLDGYSFYFILSQRCLDKEPTKRWTCEELLSHPYFQHFQFELPDQELEDFEKLRKHKDRSRVRELLFFTLFAHSQRLCLRIFMMR